MDVNAVKKHLTGKLNVPSLPAVVTELMSLMSDTDVGVSDLGRCVAKDPPLTAKLLRIANSALYGVQNPILSPEHAAAVLGVDALRNLLMRVSVLDLFEHLEDHPRFSPAALWQHSVLTARIAEGLPGNWDTQIAREDAYLCGLLHNIGVFVMLDQLGSGYIAVLEKSRTTNKSLRSLELNEFSFSHDQVGYLVCRRWSLPSVLLDAIRFHLDTAGRVETDHAVAIVHIANHIAHHVEANNPDRAADKIRKPIRSLLGLSEKAIVNYAHRAMSFREDPQD